MTRVKEGGVKRLLRNALGNRFTRNIRILYAYYDEEYRPIILSKQNILPDLSSLKAVLPELRTASYQTVSLDTTTEYTGLYYLIGEFEEFHGILYAELSEEDIPEFINTLERNSHWLYDILELYKFRYAIQASEEAHERREAEIEMKRYELSLELAKVENARKSLQLEVQKLRKELEKQEYEKAVIEINRAELQAALKEAERSRAQLQEIARGLQKSLEESEYQRAALEVEKAKLLMEKEELEKTKSILLRNVKKLSAEVEENELTYAELEIKQAELRLELEEFYEQEKSINYARYLQAHFMPSEQEIKKHFPEAFILFKPLQKLSGDFYVTEPYKESILFAVGDSTGHGIPAAMLSFMFLSTLQHILELRKMMFQWVGKTLQFNEPAEILEQLRSQTRMLMSQRRDKNLPDSIDMSLVIYNPHQDYLLYSGAMLPAVLISPKGKFHVLEPTKCPLGHYPKELPFHTIKVENVKGSIIYLFSDGYFSQQAPKTPNAKQRTFGKKRFYFLLDKIKNLPFHEQKEALEYAFSEWKEYEEQSDDITILGIKLI